MRVPVVAAMIAVVIFVLITFVKEGSTMSEFMLSSTAFQNNAFIPNKYTCDGSDVNPPLHITNVPAGTKSLALIVDDPDAPGGTWVRLAPLEHCPGNDSDKRKRCSGRLFIRAERLQETCLRRSLSAIRHTSLFF